MVRACSRLAHVVDDQEVEKRATIKTGLQPSSPALGGLNPPAKPYITRFYNFPEQGHHLGTKCSNRPASGADFIVKL